MSEQARPVRAWFEYDDAHVFSREMQRRANPEWSDIWESSVHPTGAEGVPMCWYHYNGFEMPGVPTPLRTLRVLLSTGHEVLCDQRAMVSTYGVLYPQMFSWELRRAGHVWFDAPHGSWESEGCSDSESVARAIAEAVAWVSEHEGVKA